MLLSCNIKRFHAYTSHQLAWSRSFIVCNICFFCLVFFFNHLQEYLPFQSTFSTALDQVRRKTQNAMLYFVLLVLLSIVSYFVVQYRNILYCVALNCIALHCPVVCVLFFCIVLCCVMLCCVVLCFVLFCFISVSYPILSHSIIQ